MPTADNLSENENPQSKKDDNGKVQRMNRTGQNRIEMEERVKLIHGHIDIVYTPTLLYAFT